MPTGVRDIPSRARQRRPAVEAVRDRLIRRGFPARRAVRYARELQAHWEDLRGERLEAGAAPADAEAEADGRLGTTDELVAAAVRVHRAGSFAGRHPVLCYLLTPFLAVPILPLLILAAMLLPFSEPWDDDMDGAAAPGPTPAQVDGLLVAYWSCHAAGYAVPALVAVFVHRSARRRTLSAGWAWAACAVAALSGGLESVRLAPPRGDGSGTLTVGYGGWPDPSVVCFVFAVTALAAWLLRPRHGRSRDADPAGPPDAAPAI